MDRRATKKLWKIRFDKMFLLEKQGVRNYEMLLKECQDKYKSHPIVPHFKKLITDEKKHVLLVEELLTILRRQPD